jgi:hypothetical protein
MSTRAIIPLKCCQERHLDVPGVLSIFDARVRPLRGREEGETRAVPWTQSGGLAVLLHLLLCIASKMLRGLMSNHLQWRDAPVSLAGKQDQGTALGLRLFPPPEAATLSGELAVLLLVLPNEALFCRAY